MLTTFPDNNTVDGIPLCGKRLSAVRPGKRADFTLGQVVDVLERPIMLVA